MDAMYGAPCNRPAISTNDCAALTRGAVRLAYLLQRRGVHAETQPGRRRTIRENMTQVRIADVAGVFDTLHTVAIIHVTGHHIIF